MAVVKKGKTKQMKKASRLITKSNFYALRPNAKNISVTVFDKNGDVTNRFIKNTKVNRGKIVALKGQPNYFYKGRYFWM